MWHNVATGRAERGNRRLLFPGAGIVSLTRMKIHSAYAAGSRGYVTHATFVFPVRGNGNAFRDLV
ncbi:hypothetical protein GCM10010106_28590 [Thermopolyspora flexuosa]|nr:hypothetical protein GCM10010106_28590 [Thermopolyspora flexuosa]